VAIRADHFALLNLGENREPRPPAEIRSDGELFVMQVIEPMATGSTSPQSKHGWVAKQSMRNSVRSNRRRRLVACAFPM